MWDKFFYQKGNPFMGNKILLSIIVLIFFLEMQPQGYSIISEIPQMIDNIPVGASYQSSIRSNNQFLGKTLSVVNNYVPGFRPMSNRILNYFSALPTLVILFFILMFTKYLFSFISTITRR
jgi:hypothetical protein